MGQPLPDTDLVVPTPERVSFDYQIAGLGTRAIAQIVDLLIVFTILAAVSFAALGLDAFGSSIAGYLFALIGSFVVIFGYFWASEALWSGQTVGKKIFRLRAVGDRGEPLTFSQAGVRNIIRIVDFLPYAYGIGVIVLFANGRGKRLGDLAAGTVVVKDSEYVWLWQLAGARPPAPPPAGAGDPPSTPAAAANSRALQPPGAAAPPGAGNLWPASAAELTLRRLDPELRRLVTSYARRREALPMELRAQLAGVVQARLRAAAPDVFDHHGPLAALDHLADLERHQG